MKLLTITSILTFLFMSPLLAQEEQDTTRAEELDESVEQAIDYVERNFNFGVKAGLNFSTLNDNEYLRSNAQTRLHLGVFSRYRISNRISAKAELLYSMMGAKSNRFSIFDDYTLDLNYLSLPIMAEFNITDRIALELGPYVSVLLSSRQSFSNLNENVDRVDVDNDQVNYVDVGAGIGVLYTLPTGFGAGIRYTQGFADALGDDYFGSASGSNSVTQLSVYYNF